MWGSLGTLGHPDTGVQLGLGSHQLPDWKLGVLKLRPTPLVSSLSCVSPGLVVILYLPSLDLVLAGVPSRTDAKATTLRGHVVNPPVLCKQLPAAENF